MSKEAKGPKVAFHEETTGYHHGQKDLTLYAYDEKTPEKRVLGYIQYSIFEDEIYVAYIFVHPPYRRQGIGKALVRKLMENKEPINWGLATPEGIELLRSMGLGRAEFERMFSS